MGDIAEQAVILQALKKGWEVLLPLGDRLPYDIVLCIRGVFIKIQVKAAWFEERTKNYILDTRRTKTNRKEMKRDKYSSVDFDFAIAYLKELDVFYVIPVEEFISYGSQITFVEGSKRQRKPQSAEYRDAWELIEKRAALEEIPS